MGQPKGSHRTNSAQEGTGISPTHSARYPWARAWCLSQVAVRTPFPLRGNEEEARHMAWQAKPGHILVLETQTLRELTGRLTEFYPDGTWVQL